MFSFIKNRPPLIVFFLCILTLTITVFCFAFYVKNTEHVPDTDRNHDWITLLKHFNALESCFELNYSSEVVDDNVIETRTVQALASINNTDIFKKIQNVTGFLSLEDWHTNCPKTYMKPSHLRIYFDIPETAKTNVSTFDVCVTIEGPDEYLPRFLEPNCLALSGKDGKKIGGYLSTLKIKSEDFCKNGQISKLLFFPQDRQNFANFLNENEKSLMYIHLLWTSFFLVFILLIIFIYGTIHGDVGPNKPVKKFSPHN